MSTDVCIASTLMLDSQKVNTPSGMTDTGRWHDKQRLACSKCRSEVDESAGVVMNNVDKQMEQFFCQNCSNHKCIKCFKDIHHNVYILTNGDQEEAYCKACLKCVYCGLELEGVKDYVKNRRGLACNKCNEVISEKQKNFLKQSNNYEKHRSKSLDSNPNMSPPRRSGKRTESPARTTPRHVKSNSETVTPQYVEENLEDSTKHTRGLSIDDMLDLTLYNEDDDDVKEMLATVNSTKPLKSPKRNGVLVDVPVIRDLSGIGISLPNNHLVNKSPVQEPKSQPVTNGSKISRSLSMKPASFVSNLKQNLSKTISGSSNQSDNEDFDTHSGWGVTSNKPQLNSSLSTREVAGTKIIRQSPRNKSDGNVYPITDQTPSSIHKRTNSSNMTSPMTNNVAMYCTPPIETNSSFVRLTTPSQNYHYRKTSLQGADNVLKEEDHGQDLGVDNYNTSLVGNDIPTMNAYLESETADSELLLRKTKSELRDLEHTKMSIAKDIEALKLAREKLIKEVKQLRSEKESLTVPREKSAPNISSPIYNTPKKQTSKVEPNNSATKGKFWKLFSGSNNNNSNNGNSNSHGNTSANTSLKRSNTSVTGLQGSPNIVPSFQNETENSIVSVSSSMVNGENIFDSSLIARCQFENNKIPILITTCVEKIEENDETLKTVGLYRKTSSKSLLEEIENAFAVVKTESDIKDNLKKLLDQDIHAVTSILKRYLRRLPNPVLTYQIYDQLISLVKDNDLMAKLPNASIQANTTNPLLKSTISFIKEILKVLPPEHYALLQFLSKHISTVAKYSDDNLMTIYNLSVVFAPGLLHDPDGEKDIIDMKQKNYIIEFIITNQSQIFASPPHPSTNNNSSNSSVLTSTLAPSSTASSTAAHSSFT